jgi:hypothetical protein
MDRLGDMVFAKANHVRFAVDDDRGGPLIHGDDPRPEVVHTLWEFFEGAHVTDSRGASGARRGSPTRAGT